VSKRGVEGARRTCQTCLFINGGHDGVPAQDLIEEEEAEALEGSDDDDDLVLSDFHMQVCHRALDGLLTVLSLAQSHTTCSLHACILETTSCTTSVVMYAVFSERSPCPLPLHAGCTLTAERERWQMLMDATKDLSS